MNVCNFGRFGHNRSLEECWCFHTIKIKGHMMSMMAMWLFLLYYKLSWHTKFEYEHVYVSQIKKITYSVNDLGIQISVDFWAYGAHKGTRW